MKKKILALLLSVGVLSSLTGCQAMTKSFGGETIIELPPNTKLEMITWKEAELWYLTRPMTEDDIAEVHTYQEQSEFGVFEGTVTIIESKTE